MKASTKQLSLAAVMLASVFVVTGGILYGNILSGLAQFPGLLLEYAANLVVFAVLYKPVTKNCRVS